MIFRLFVAILFGRLWRFYSVVCDSFVRSFVKNSVQSRGLVIAILFVTRIFAENYKSNNNKSPASIIACRTLLFTFSLFFDLKVPLGIPKGDACLSKKATIGRAHYSLGRSPLERSVSHATGRAQCRQECCESGYYHLHHYLNQSILLHF